MMPMRAASRRNRAFRQLRTVGMALALLLGPAALATTYVRHAPQAMVELADRIFVGTVASVTVQDREGTPWTEVGFDVEVLLKGVVEGDAGDPQSALTLSFLGGDLPGGRLLSVAGMPRFEVGEQLLVFAYEEPYASPIVGFRQGLWHVTPGGLRDEDGGLLSLDADGELVTGGEGASLEGIVDALRATLPPLEPGEEGTP